MDQHGILRLACLIAGLLHHHSSAGPLEATINSLQHEIDAKGLQGRDLQRRWIQHQTELVALQNENASLTEDVARLKAEHTVVGCCAGPAWLGWVAGPARML